MIIADRINTMKIHRADVFKAMKTVGTRVVIIWELSVKEAVSRIKERSFGHRTITPDLNAHMIVGRTAKDFEPLSQEEIEEYHIQKVITIRDPLSMSRQEVIKTILNKLIFTPGLIPLDLRSITDSDIDKAVKKNIKREEDISAENEKLAKKPTSEQLAKEGRYEIAFGDNQVIKEYLDLVRPKNAEFQDKTEFHLTLLYMKRKLTDYINGTGKAPEGLEIPPPEVYRGAIRKYNNLIGKDVLVKLQYAARNDRVAAIRAQIREPALPHFDVIPHISLAKIKNAEFRESNSLIEKCDSLRHYNRSSTENDGIEWIDLDCDIEITGRIKFRRHGQ
jgi:hypothetical protein